MTQSREIKTFIFSQYFSDGLRITLGVLLPSLISFHLDQVQVGITISLGALAVSIVDNPGPVIHKRNGMLFCTLFVFLTAVLTGLINQYPILVGVEILVLSFFFTMFSVYGNRASAIGTAALLIMIITIDHKLTILGTFQHALYVVTGGLWYVVLSLALAQIRPFRPAQQALGECIKEVANYVRLKAAFYDSETDFEQNYKKLIDQQVLIHEQQDAVREILFKSRMMMKDTTPTGRLLILTFVDIEDLFEQTMATFYDYQAIMNIYGETGVLNEFKIIIEKVADELDDLSFIITSNYAVARMNNLGTLLEKLKSEIDLVETKHGLSNLVLKKILINARNMVSRTQKMYSYFNPKTLAQEKIRSKSDLGKFVSHQNFGIKYFRDNLIMESGIFRHALRVSLVMLIGYLISKLFPAGYSSYWILLTILVILKPGFSLTKKRNYARLVGTVAGGLGGVLLLIVIKDQTVLFFLLLLFMVAAYSFQRLNYVVSVIFMTPYVLILFHFIGNSDSLLIARERIIDTFIGSAVALIANYFIFPTWEYQQLKSSVRELLIANYRYLLNVASPLVGKEWDITAYKLARKDVYVSSANVGSAFQRMLSEPKSKQKHVKDLQRFVVLNHMLASYTATLISSLEQRKAESVHPQHLKLIRKCLFDLIEAIRQVDDPTFPRFKEAEPIIPALTETAGSANFDNDARLLTEQLNLVKTTTRDILKNSSSLASLS